MKRKKKSNTAERSTVLEILINWPLRKVTVTSKTGGHVATCYDMGNTMEIKIDETPKT